MSEPRILKPGTVAVHAGRPRHEADQPFNTPVTFASTYVAGGDLEYGRYGNPTWTAFEDALGELEGGRCLSFASGLAAVATIFDLVGTGQKVVAPRHSYNGTIMQLGDLESRGRLTAELVDVTDTDAVVKACDDASLVWLESPTNPALEVADIPTITAAAHEAGAYVVVDNTFATPLLQRPLELDADIVVHSATKYLAGHSDVLMGAVITRDDELFGVLKNRRDLIGAVPGPMEAYLALRGLRTLQQPEIWGPGVRATSRVPDLAAWVAQNAQRLVLKKSWDYGGKSVHLGAETEPAAWERVVREAAAERRGGGFVAQERIFATRRPATRITPAGPEAGSLYRDVSTYGGLLPVHPGGSVVRAAASPIVNILGGGGLSPVVPADVWEALC
jgi:hypothetical protein